MWFFDPEKNARRIPIAPGTMRGSPQYVPNAPADELHYRSPAARRTACGVWLFPHAHVAFTQEPDAAIVEWAEGRGCGTCADAARDELKRRAS